LFDLQRVRSEETLGLRVVDVMEELFKFTLLTRDVAPYLVARYSERKESTAEVSRRVNQRAT
jgi:arsenic resistance protein ArsH